jgi:hypothetical protein
MIVAKSVEPMFTLRFVDMLMYNSVSCYSQQVSNATVMLLVAMQSGHVPEEQSSAERVRR